MKMGILESGGGSEILQVGIIDLGESNLVIYAYGREDDLTLQTFSTTWNGTRDPAGRGVNVAAAFLNVAPKVVSDYIKEVYNNEEDIDTLGMLNKHWLCSPVREWKVSNESTQTLLNYLNLYEASATLGVLAAFKVATPVFDVDAVVANKIRRELYIPQTVAAHDLPVSWGLSNEPYGPRDWTVAASYGISMATFVFLREHKLHLRPVSVATRNRAAPLRAPMVSPEAAQKLSDQLKSNVG